MAEKDLSKQDISELVYSYASPAVTDELYRFGAMMLSDLQDRVGRIESKSVTVLGWATAILAFLFVETNKTSSSIGLYFASACGLFTLLAVFFSFLALRTRGDWKSPSDKSWFKEKALVNEDELKRYHIRVMHDIRQWHLQITQRKSVWLICGEISLIVGAVLLFAGIGVHLLPASGVCVACPNRDFP